MEMGKEKDFSNPKHKEVIYMERCELESREKEKKIERERKEGMPVGFKCNLKDLTTKSINSGSSQWAD